MKLRYLAVALLFAAPAMGQQPPQPFNMRCNAQGVLRCVDFSDPSVISGRYGDHTGLLQSTIPEPFPTIDNMVKPLDGAVGSLHWTLAVGDGGTTSYFANFTDTFTLFDSCNSTPNQCEFYVQWRQRFDPNFLANTGFEDGFKQAIIGAGDNPGCTPSMSLDCAGSCTDLEVVTQNSYWRGFPQMYHSCGAKDQQYEPLNEALPPDGFNKYLQNMPRIGTPPPPNGCLYNGGNPVLADCFIYYPNEWMTFQVHVRIGTWYQNQCAPGAIPGCPPGSYSHDSVIELWVARPGLPAQLVLSHKPQSSPDTCHAQYPNWSEPPCQTGYDLVNLSIATQKYGKVWLLPRSGNRTFYQFPSNTWVAELIISRNKIADPSQ